VSESGARSFHQEDVADAMPDAQVICGGDAGNAAPQMRTSAVELVMPSCRACGDYLLRGRKAFSRERNTSASSLICGEP